jgi:hypothetical protein
VRQIAFGMKLHHLYRPNGKGALRSEPLTDPDDITTPIGGHFYVTFQNNVGPAGAASPDGNLDSTLVEFTLTGKEVRQWDVRGHCDGLTADPALGIVIGTINEDGNSSLVTIAVSSGRLTHYAYNKSPLPHNGGTDAISIYRGQILISASAPGTIGAKAPKPYYPAIYVTTLNPMTRIATVRALYYDEALALALNGPHAGTIVHLALTDPDSNEVVPNASPRFGGDFMLDSQGDQELIFDRPTGSRQSLAVLHITRSVDDSAWPTTAFGALYVTDATDDTVDTVSGGFAVGTMYSSVTPCDQNDAPATCPGPGFPPNYLASDNLKTGVLTPVALTGPVLHPKGMVFIAA